METVKKKLEEFANLRVQVQKQAEAIKEDKDLTLGARSRKLKELKEETDEKLVRLREEYRERAEEVAKSLEEEFPGIGAQPIEIGPIIGTHVGPGLIGFQFYYC
jgi:fatty acid-binding protein DegV